MQRYRGSMISEQLVGIQRRLDAIQGRLDAIQGRLDAIDNEGGLTAQEARRIDTLQTTLSQLKQELLDMNTPYRYDEGPVALYRPANTGNRR